MKAKEGFTLIEVGLVLVVVALVTVLVLTQKSNIEATRRDETRKTAINAMHYGLKSFYQKNQFYPTTISEENLPVVETSLWTDPSGRRLGTPLSEYIYEPADCRENECKEYILKAKLEKEEDYLKTSGD